MSQKREVIQKEKSAERFVGSWNLIQMNFSQNQFTIKCSQHPTSLLKRERYRETILKLIEGIAVSVPLEILIPKH